MKVKFLGTGQMGVKRKNTSFVADNSILFDIGNGIMDALIQNDLDIKDIRYIIISHFHTDHFGDLVYFLHRRKIMKLTDMSLCLIGPAGLRQKLLAFNELLMPDTFDGVSTNVEFAELNNGESYKNAAFALKAFKVIHGSLNCNGYIFAKDKVTLGYSGDSSYCDSIISNIKNAKTWVIEANDLTEMKDVHIGLNQVEELAAKHKDTNFYVVHRKDYPAKTEFKNIIFPDDNQTINI